MQIEPVWNSKVGSRPGVRGGRSVEKLRSRGAANSVFTGVQRGFFFFFFFQFLWGPAPNPPVLTSFEGKAYINRVFLMESCALYLQKS